MLIMRRSLVAALRIFPRDITAVTAIEFSIWAPLMCLIVFGGFDMTRYAIATERITNVASTIGQMLSVNTSGTVNYVDLQFYHDSAMVIYPQVLADAAQQNESWSNDMAITMSSVTFTATPAGCTSSCTYKPKLVWTSGSHPRSCTVTMTAASDTSAPSPSTLPTDTFGATSLLVVDVIFTFRPLIAGSLLSQVNMKIARSFYIAPRYVTSVGYQTISGDPGTTTVCT